MSILDTFYILFKGDTSALDKGVEDADKKAGGLIDKLQKVDEHATAAGGSFVRMVEGLAGLAGVTLGLGALVAGVKATAEEYTQLERLAAQFRSTTAAVDDFRDASALLGISEEKSTQSLHSLEAAIQDVHLGMGRAKRVFEELGISIHDKNGKIKATTTVMEELSTKFQKMDKGTQIRVMERLGLDPALLKLFNSDLGALQRRMEEVDRAAKFNLEDAVKRSTEFTKASKGLGIELNVLKMFLGKLSEAFKIQTLPLFTKAIQTVTGYVKAFTQYLMDHSRFVQGVFIAIGGAISAYLIPAAIRGALAVFAMISPFLLIGAAIAAVVAIFALLYDDIQAFREGNESAIGHILKRWPMVGEILSGIGEVLKFLGGVVVDLGLIFGAVMGKIGDAILFVAKFFSGDLVQGIGTANSAMQVFFALVTAPLRLFLELLGMVLDKFGGVAGIAKSFAGLVRTGLDAAKTALGVNLPAPTAAALAAGQTQLSAAASSPLSSVTSNAISNTRRGGDRNVTIDKVEVNTQATDAEGISRSIGDTLGSHLRRTTNHFDDGVLG
jgi:hypothetical protein